MEEAISKDTYRKGFKHSSTMAMCSVVKGILAAFPPILIAKNIGLGNITDSYLMALSINQIIIKFTRMGTLPKAFIMALSEDFVKGQKNFERSVNNLLNISILVSVLVMILIYVSAPFLVNLIARGFDVDRRILTIKVIRILSPLFLYHFILRLFESIFRLSNEFSRWAILDIFPALVVGSVVFVYISKIGIYSVIYGTMAGAFLHLLLIWYFIYFKFKYAYRLELNFKHYLVRKIPKLLFPFYLSSVFVQMMLGVQSFLASLLAPGVASAFFYVLRLNEYVENFFINIVSQMALPYFIKKVALSSIEKIKDVYCELICLINYAFLPMLVMLAVFGVSMVTILFGSKSSDPSVVFKLGAAFSCFMIFFLPEPSTEMLSNVLLSVQKTMRVNLVNISRMIIVIFLSIILFRVFNFWGIIFSYSLTYLQGFIMHQRYLTRKYSFKNIFINRNFLKIVLLNVLLLIFCLFLNNYALAAVNLAFTYQKITLIALAGFLGILFYGLCSYLFKSEELKILLSMIGKKSEA